MKTKRIISLSIVLCFGLVGFAQTQQGYVKTRGHMVNGKHVEGRRVSNATVQIEGHSAVLSGKDGTFSVPLTSKSFSLKEVRKKGYVLFDPDILYRTYSYSSNPLELVLEDSLQRETERRAIERKVRSSTYEELQRQREEIERLWEQNRITDEKYRELLQKHNADQDKNDTLIKDLVDWYMKTDFDHLNNQNRRIADALIDGRLHEADSLINSQGDPDKLEASLRRQQAAEAQKAEFLAQQQAELEMAVSATQKQLEDLAQNYYNRHTLCRRRYNLDSAAYWLERRALLDTNNTDAVWDYALFAHQQYNIAEAEKYYLICYRAYTNQNNQFKLTILQNNLVTLYRDKGDYGSCIKYCMQSLNRSAKEFADNPQNNHCRAHLAHSQLNLGNLYRDFYERTSNLKFADSSEMYFKMALGHFERLSAREPDNRWDLALAQNDLGNIYMLKKDYINSEKYYNLALATYKKMDTSIEVNKDGYAQTLFNLGDLNYNQQNYSSSEMYYKLAFEKFGQLYVNNHDTYRDKLILTYSNLLLMYAENRQLKNKAELMGKYRSLFIDDTTAIGLLQNDAIVSLYKIAINYAYQQEYSYSVCIIDEAIVLMPLYADLYELKGFLLLNLNKDQEALKMWHKVLELNPNFLDDYLDGTNLSNGLKAKGLIK